MAKPDLTKLDNTLRRPLDNLDQVKAAKMGSRAVDLDHSKSKTWADTFAAPFVGFKHLCQRFADAFHGNEDNVIRQCHRDLSDTHLKAQDKKVIVATIENINPSADSKHAVAQALLSLAQDKNIDGDVRLAAVRRVHELEPTHANRSKIVKSILGIAQSPKSDLNTRMLAAEWLLASKALTSQSDSRQQAVLQGLGYSLIRGGGVPKETFLALIGAYKGGVRSKADLCIKYAQCAAVSAQDRLEVLEHFLSQQSSPRSIFRLNDVLAAYHGMVEGLSPEERQGFIRDRLLPLMGTRGADRIQNYCRRNPSFAA